jgi:UDP-N-acetylglucosamine transferase subunit ALG13
MGARRKRRSGAPLICIAASPGGHLDLLAEARDAFEGYERVWITGGGRRAEQLAASGEAVEVLPPVDKAHVNLRNPAAGLRLAARLRPDAIVTSGAGMVLTFCAAARLRRTPLLFAETMARVEGPSLSGRLFGRLADRVAVQWPELLPHYRNAALCRPTLLERIGTPGAGEGTVVTVGSHSQPFDRLLRMVDEAVGAGVLPGPVVAQTGASSYRPSHYEPEPWVSPGRLEEAIGSSRYVIAHSGSGAIAGALRAGRRPLVLPRERAQGEHVDDHQRQLAGKLGALDLVVPLEGPISPAELERADRALPETVRFDSATTLAGYVQTWLTEVTGSPGPPQWTQ